MRSAEESHSAAVERALAILEVVAQRSHGMTHSEISRKLEIPKSTLTYLLRALETRGYLRREDGTGKYLLGLKVLALARGVEMGADIKEIARPVLKRLVERSGLTAHLAMLDDSHAVYVEKADSPGFIKMDTWVGKRMELHSTAVGKVLLAWMPAPEVTTLLKGHTFKRRTPKTITTHAGLLQELDRVRVRGYGMDDEENSLAARCIAAPVLDQFGRAIAAVGLSGTTGQIDKASIRKVAEMVQEAAREIARRFSQPAARHHHD